MARALTARQRAIMAVFANRDRRLRVVELYDRPPCAGRLGVARIAVVRGVESLIVLPGLRAYAAECAAVATHTIAREGAVIHAGRFPTRQNVARAALRGGRNVRGRVLAERKRVVVALIARRDRRLGMIECDDRLPLARRLGVTSVAGVAGLQSLVVFAGLRAHARECAAMAAHTIAGERAVINRRRFPHGLRVARRTLRRGRQVRGGIFSLCQRAVVALVARRDRRLRMIKRHDRLPLRGRLRVTGVAVVGGREPLVVFAALAANAGDRATVTADTIANERGVVHRCRGPRALRMTRGTLRGGRQVRGSFAFRQRIVVALIARGNHGLRVIELDDRLPLRGELAVARLALVRGAQSLIVLSALAAGVHTVMTSHATVDDIGVINGRAGPCARGMACTTIQRRGHVAGALPGRQHAVVALPAHRDRRLRVVERQRGLPFAGRFRMTRVAGVRRLQSRVVFPGFRADARE